MQSARAAVSLLALAVGLSGCEMLPRSGPDHDLIAANATVSQTVETGQSSLQYALVDISKSILNFLIDPGAGSLYSSFGGGRGPAVEIKVGVGDIIQVTIFESSAGGLFIPSEAGSRSGNFVQLPVQTVDRAGAITVPYAGQIPAAGRSLSEIQADINAKLSNRAIEPQAVVSLVSQISAQATVVGEVGTPAKIAISPDGERILDIIAKAGGIRYPGYETFITLERGKRRATVWFDAIIRNPTENIFVVPKDTIYVYREQRAFTAFGATGQSGQFKFDADKLTLADAVGKAGGLLDSQADPRQVFLYRLTDRKTLIDMGVDVSKFDPNVKAIPTIYRTSFRDPAGFFAAQKFPMQNQDVIYVSNAEQVELYKFLDLIQTVSGTAGAGGSDVTAVNTASRASRRW
jgi:polysaccharide export outer membrane protein